jgi:hypothetical protein
VVLRRLELPVAQTLDEATAELVRRHKVVKGEYDVVLDPCGRMRTRLVGLGRG